MAKQDRRTRKQRAKRRPRVIIGTSAYLDEHPDLVAWWQSLPEGQGSEILRTIIRTHLATQGVSDQQQILALLHNLSRDVKAIGQQIKGAAYTAPELPTTEESGLSEAEQEQILSNVLDNQW